VEQLALNVHHEGARAQAEEVRLQPLVAQLLPAVERKREAVGKHQPTTNIARRTKDKEAGVVQKKQKWVAAVLFCPLSLHFFVYWLGRVGTAARKVQESPQDDHTGPQSDNRNLEVSLLIAAHTRTTKATALKPNSKRK
jgi:hypothetical protein